MHYTIYTHSCLYSSPCDNGFSNNIFNKKNASRNVFLNICNLVSLNRNPNPLYLIPILLIHEKTTPMFDYVINPKSLKDIRGSKFIKKKRFKHGSRSCSVRAEFSDRGLFVSVPFSDIKHFEAYNIICSDKFKDYNFPLYIFRLSKGFMYRLYYQYVCPNLKHAITRCTGVEWDKIKSEGIFTKLPNIDTTNEIQVAQNIENVNHLSKSDKLESDLNMANEIIDAEMSDSDNELTVKEDDIKSFELLIAKYIKSIKEIVFVYKSIKFLRDILSRDPTIDELNYAFDGYTPNSDIWNDYINHKKDIYNEFHVSLFKTSHEIANNRWNILKKKYLNREYLDETIRRRLAKYMFDMELDIICPNIEKTIIDSLWHILANVSALKLNSINGKVVKFATDYMYKCAYIEIYKSLQIDINKILQARVANRLIDSFKYKRSALGADKNKDAYTLYNELMSKVSDKMGISVQSINESIDYANQRIVNLKDSIPRNLRNESLQSYKFYDGIKTFGDLCTEDPNIEDASNFKNDIFIHAMRLLALESLRDRVGRFVFMALNGLFISESQMSVAELANVLGMNEKIIDFIKYTSFVRCAIYESNRVSRGLPSFIKLYQGQENYFTLDLPHNSYYTNKCSRQAKEIRINGLKDIINMPIISQIKYYKVNRKRIIDNFKKSPLSNMFTFEHQVEEENQLFPDDL